MPAIVNLICDECKKENVSGTWTFETNYVICVDCKILESEPK